MNEDDYLLISDMQRLRQIQMLLGSMSPRIRHDTYRAVALQVARWEDETYAEVTRRLEEADPAPTSGR